MTYAVLNDFHNFPRIKKEYSEEVTDWYDSAQRKCGQTLISVNQMIEWFNNKKQALISLGWSVDVMIDMMARYDGNEYYLVTWRWETDEEYLARYQIHLDKKQNGLTHKKRALESLEKKVAKKQKEYQDSLDKLNNLKKHIEDEDESA